MSDFAVFLTIVIMVLIDLGIGIPSPKLHVPHVFKVTGLGIGGEGFWHLMSGQGWRRCWWWNHLLFDVQEH